MKSKKNNKFNFEKTLTELEKIVDTMEQGGVGLSESLDLFAKGTKLVTECQKALKDTEQKIKILSGKELVELELDEEDDDE